MAKGQRESNCDAPLVAVVMGSDSDLETMMSASDILDKFGVSNTVEVASAHRSPNLVRKRIKAWEAEGVKIIIAGAGCAAHLPGVIASETRLPVIGVPLSSPPFNGIDSVLSMLPMPQGIPVATMSVGKTGAANAALFAVRILALENSELADKLSEYAKDLEKKVIEKNQKLKTIGPKKFLESRKT